MSAFATKARTGMAEDCQDRRNMDSQPPRTVSCSPTRSPKRRLRRGPGL